MTEVIPSLWRRKPRLRRTKMRDRAIIRPGIWDPYSQYPFCCTVGDPNKEGSRANIALKKLKI